jgi:multiple sugar transport system substrate-binding protein
MAIDRVTTAWCGAQLSTQHFYKEGGTVQRRPWRLTLKWLLPLSLLAMVAFAATPGLAGRPAARAADQPITIQLWDSNTFTDLAKVLDKMMLAYEKLHPNVTLKLVHNQTLDKDLAAIASGNGPDVIWLWDSAQPIANWAVNGVIQPLDKYITNSHYDLTQLVPAAVKQVSWRGRVYGLPLVADTYWLWYRADDFRAAGLDPNKPPTTLDELMADAQKLTKRTGSGRILRLGYAIPSFSNGNGVGPYNAVFGASAFNADGTKVTPDSPANLAAWHELRNEHALFDKLFGHDALVRFSASMGSGFSNEDPFLKDRLSMKIDGDWVPQQVRDYSSPQLKYGVNYMVAPVPYPKGYAQFANHQGLACYPLVMTSTSKHPAETWDFIRWLQSPSVTSAMAAYLYNLPQFKAAMDNPQLTKLPAFGPMLSMLRTGKVTLVSDPTSPITEEYFNVLGSYNTKIINGQITPEQATKATRQRVQPELDKLLKGS